MVAIGVITPGGLDLAITDCFIVPHGRMEIGFVERNIRGRILFDEGSWKLLPLFQGEGKEGQSKFSEAQHEIDMNRETYKNIEAVPHVIVLLLHVSLSFSELINTTS